jgi:hypothetical protein
VRLVILLVGATATGALSAGAIQTMFPQTKQTFQAVLALGGDLKNFKISDINPVKAYQDVMREVTSGRTLSLPTSPTYKSNPIDWDKLQRPDFKIEKWSFQPSIPVGTGSPIQPTYHHIPMQFHGVPRH